MYRLNATQMFQLMDKLQGRRNLSPSWSQEVVVITCDELRKAINKFPVPTAQSRSRGSLRNRNTAKDGSTSIRRGRYKKPDGTYTHSNEYPPEFKARIMAEINKPLPNKAFIAREYGISVRTVTRWANESEVARSTTAEAEEMLKEPPLFEEAP